MTIHCGRTEACSLKQFSDMKSAWSLPQSEVVLERIKLFESIAKFFWGTPSAEFSKLWDSTARQHGSVGRRNLACWIDRSKVSIRHRFQTIWKRKNFFHPAVWHVLLAQKWPLHIDSLWDNRGRQRKTIFGFEMSRKLATIWGGFRANLNFDLMAKFSLCTPFSRFSKL